MKTSFSNVARAMVLAACVLGVAARIPKPMVVEDLRKAVTPKQTAIDDLMNAGTPKKTAIDEERRRSYGSLHGKTAPTRLVHVPIADSCCPSLGYLIMRAETFDDEGIVCGGIKECDFFCKSLGFSCGKCQENPSACRCEETCY